MTNLEHYFENLLFHPEIDKDGGDPNSKSLSIEQIRTAQVCARYVLYTLHWTRENFNVNEEVLEQVEKDKMN